MESSNFQQGTQGFQIKNDGTAEFQSITVRGNFSGTVDGATTVTNNFITTGSGSFETASSGTARVQLGATNPNEVRFLNSSNQTLGLLESDGSDVFLQATLSTSADLKLVAGIAGDIIFQGGDIDFTNGLTQSPIIKIEGSSATNKKLGVNSSGRLEFQSDSIGSHTHSESDISDIGSHNHSSSASWLSGFASSSSVSALSSSLTSHVGHATSFVESLTASGTSGSVTGDVTIDSNAGGGGFISGNPTRSGNTINIGASVNGFIGQATPHGSTRKIGISASNRFNNIYSQNFFGTFYGLNINASSKNIKENIEDTALGLDFINDLEVKDFTMIDTDTFGTQKFTGFIAEDVQKYLDDNDLDYKLTEDYRDKYEYKDSCSHPIVPDPQDEDQTITYMHDTVEECEAYMPDENRHPHLYFNNFVGPLVKAVQELSEMNADLKARIEVLEGG